jgi:hypothetical protein
MKEEKTYEDPDEEMIEKRRAYKPSIRGIILSYLFILI